MQRLIVPNHVLLPEVERQLACGTSVTLRVKGNSMLPFIIGDRDSVVLKQTDQPRKGDIVLARLVNGCYVLHRIVALQGQEVVLRGDANLMGTERCCMDNISGKVIKIIRNGKYVDADSPIEKCKATLWESALPIRRYLLALYKRIYKR